MDVFTNFAPGETVSVDESLFIGKGSGRETYLFPGREGLCIKIAYNEDGIKDDKREIRVRKKLQKLGIESKIMTRYYGMVNTNKGLGHVFELVCNSDGSTAKALTDYMKNPEEFKANFDKIVEALLFVKKQLFAEKIVTMHIFTDNILFRKDGDNLKPYFCNDFGVSSVIPLAYYFEALNVKRSKKKWLAFVNRIKDEYPYEDAIRLADLIK